MAVLDIPRIHFRGIARVHAPTGANNLFGNIDIRKNAVLIDGRSVEAACPATDFHDYLRTHGTRYDATGKANPQGPFSTAAGWDFGGNGHFSWHETRVTAVQLTAGSVCTEDALVGSYVELWGHYNEYLRTTSNRARWIDIDPSSRWTTQISAGQLTVGRTASTIRTPTLLSAEFDCPHSTRWLRCDRVPVLAANVNAWHIGASRLFQFSVPKGRQLGFAEESGASRALQALQTALEVPEIRGITVQYCVFNMSTPIQPDAPIFYDLIGTIGVWRHGELATLPAGRMLVPADAAAPLGTASVLIDAGWARFNLANAVPFRNREVERRSAVHPTHDLGPPFLQGDLELREQNGRLLTKIPERHWTQGGKFLELGGILDTPLETCASPITSAHALELQMVTHGERRVVLREREWVLESDESVLSVESRDVTRNNDHATRVELFSWYRGVPTEVDINIHQYRNPYGAAADSCVVAEINTVEFAAIGSNSPEFSPSCTVRTDANGQGAVLLRGTAAGSARLALATAKERWWPAGAEGDAVVAYDNANRLRHWECEGQLHIRVLPDDWHLLDVSDSEVTFEYIYKHVLSYYELVYPFMRNAVFSLADPSKCATYARLMWQMCDPQNKSRSYYMPSTRELSYPKALLFRKYLRTVEQSAAVPTAIVTAELPLAPLGSREALLIALKSAATLELTIMLQYLYAAYSLPSFEAGRNLVAQGQWTPEHLREVCGDGQERYAQGWRGTLLEISHEEMIHYLLINNIITQMGEPFYPAFPAFGVDGLGLGLDTELALEAFSPLVLERFIRLEWPGYFALGVSDSAECYRGSSGDLQERAAPGWRASLVSQRTD
jgi:hypothetical protein